MFNEGLLVGSFVGLIFGLAGCFNLTINHNVLLPKDKWICVEVSQISKNVDDLECISYNKK